MSHTQVVAAVSALVLQILESEQPTVFAVPLAPLSEGRVLLGRERLGNRSAPSSVIFVPLRSRFGPPSTKSQTVPASDGSGKMIGLGARLLQRPLATEHTDYEVHVWGQHRPADPEKDFNATTYLVHVVVSALQLLAMSSVTIGDGVWEDQQEGQAQIVKAGHRYIFGCSIAAPVRDSSVQFVPGALTQVPTVTITPEA